MIGIISDTHEQADKIKKAVAIFSKRKVEFVVHCGDIISPPILRLFKGMKLKAVFGNNDGEKTGLNSVAKEMGFEEIEETKRFEYKGKKFLVNHGLMDIDSAVKSQEFDYILTGHTHQQANSKKGITRIINPGSLFGEKCSIALLDARKDTLEFIEIR